MHGFANILMNDVYYSSLQHEENDLQDWLVIMLIINQLCKTK